MAKKYLIMPCVNNKIKIRQAKISDLQGIILVLSNWLFDGEIEHYLPYIKNSIRGEQSAIKYDNHYFVAIADKNKIIGVASYRRPIPKVRKFAHTKKPAELNMLYLKPDYHSQGIGSQLLSHLEERILINGYQEILVRSSDRFKDIGWGFYDRHDFKRVGKIKEENGYSQIWNKHLVESDTILVGNKKFIPGDNLLPVVIHGLPKVGASLFTVVFCAQLIKKKHQLVFISAYPMAKVELLKRIDAKKTLIINGGEDIKKINNQPVIIYSGINSKIIRGIIKKAGNHHLVCLKNLEEYSQSVFRLLSQRKNVIFSGDFSKIKQDKILSLAKTKLFFSEYNYPIPKLKKYEGYIIGEEIKGKIKLSK